MAVTLSAAYLAELKKNENIPNIIIEAEIVSTRFLADGTYLADGSITAGGSESAGVEKWGEATGGFNDVLPIIKANGVSSLQNKLDTKKGYSTRGTLTVTLVGRDNFKNLIADNYLMSRRITRKDGFIAPGFLYSDYADTFTGKILDWSRKGDTLTLTIGDDMMVDAKKNLPVENDTKTQFLDYRNTNPVDIMQDILINQLNIDPALIDTTAFDEEQETWLNSWIFDRVITKPEKGDELLNQLQIETNSFIVQDGEKVTFKHFAPPTPATNVQGINDDDNIQANTFTQQSGYRNDFFNRVVVYFNYDESGNNEEENYENAFIAIDPSSSDSSQWSKESTKVIKSKWMHSFTYDQPTMILGVVIYHASVSNGAGDGTLLFNKSALTLQWTPPGDTAGIPVKITKDGKYTIFATDTTKWIRVIVTFDDLPGINKTDTIAMTAISGASHAEYIGTKNIRRYRDPVSTVKFVVDINDVSINSKFIKPTDFVNLTTDEAVSKDDITWVDEYMMITSVRPDFNKGKVNLEAVQTKLVLNYGFISPAGFPDFSSATTEQRRYGYIGDVDNKVDGGTENGYYIW